MSNEEVEEVKNEEATEPVANEIVETTKEEQPTEEIKEEETNTTPVEQIKEVVKPKATVKKLPRTVKVVELVSCEACSKKNDPKEFKKYSPLLLQGPTNRNIASK